MARGDWKRETAHFNSVLVERNACFTQHEIEVGPASLLIVGRANGVTRIQAFLRTRLGLGHAFGRDTDPVLRALADAGFEQERIDVFQGAEGAARLDPEGRHHGLWVRFRRYLEGKFDEGHEVLHRAEETLQSGGTVVEVFTNGEPAKKDRVAEVLKAAGGTDILYWGRLMTEYM